MKLFDIFKESLNEEKEVFLGDNPKTLTLLTRYLEGNYQDGLDYIAHVGHSNIPNVLILKNPSLPQDMKLLRLINLAKESNINEITNPVDTITFDIPLFIRLLEYAKEDAKSDMDLHAVAERAINLANKKRRVLKMSDYEDLMLATKF